MHPVLDHRLIAQRYFFPRSDPIANPFVVPVDGAELHCFRSTRAGATHTLLHFHGNGEVVADYKDDWVDAMNDLGVHVVLAEYRGYGGSTGAPTLGVMLEDAMRVVEALGVEQELLFIYGRSVGSLFAVEVAHRCPHIAGLILESAVADVSERLLLRVTPAELGVDDATFHMAMTERLDHEAKLGGYAGRMLVIHARDDELVGPSHAEASLRWGAGDAKRLVMFDRGGHNAILAVNWHAYLDALGDFIQW